VVATPPGRRAGTRPPRLVRPPTPGARDLGSHDRRHARRPRRGHPLARAVERSTLALGAVLGLALLAAVAGVAADRAYHGRVLPGVRFAALPLGGLGEAQAKGLLDAHTHAFLASPAVFTYGESVWRPTAAEVGIALDSRAMARAALRIGREAPPVLRLAQLALTAAVRPQVSVQVTLDRQQLAAFLGAVALEVDREPVSAALAVRNGELAVGQSAPGRRVDIAATMQRVRAPQSLEPQRVEVVVTAVPPGVGDEGVREAQATAGKILSAPLTLRSGARTWTLTPAALGTMLDFKRVSGRGAVPAEAGVAGASDLDPSRGDAGRDRLVAALNEAKVAAYVRTIAAQIDKPAVDAQFRWTGSGVVVVRESADGLKLDQAAAAQAILAQAGTDNREVALVVTAAKPAISSDSVGQLGITRLIATGTSRFAGSSPERANNIRVATNRLNGVVIAPGATFSFLAALGPITKENGYKEGLTIQGDATVPGIGGGVCQVSTTAFRAAFYAGLPIVERHQHTYRVSYYEQDGSPVGFDAAVYSPGVDLRFRNDTGAAVLIQTGIDTAASTVAFRFYGAATGREVKLESGTANEVKAGPRLPDGTDPTLPAGERRQVEWRADGVDATIRRTVLQGGQPLLADTFFSRYVPWQEKWVVGAGPPAPAPQSPA
jgi:vancomycin resistance protein YoaR